VVELQKQMIELAQQHEQSKRRRDALREQMMREVTDRRPGRRGLRHRLQQSAAKLLKRMPVCSRKSQTSARSTTNNHRHAESHRNCILLLRRHRSGDDL